MNGNFTIVAGGVTFLVLLFRVLYVLEQEFSKEEKLVKEPLGVAANGALSFEKFADNNWQAYAALWAAMRFRLFLSHFEFLLEPQHGKMCVMMLLAFYILLIVSIAEEFQVLTGIFATIINTSWMLLIERGKSLKKSVAKLVVS